MVRRRLIVIRTTNSRVAFMFTGSFMGLAYLVASSDALVIFNYLVSAVTIFGSLTWISILSSHVGFMRGMKAQGIPRDTLPFKAPFQPYLTYFALVFTVILSIFKGFDSFMPWDYKNFITAYIGIPVYIIGYTGYKRESFATCCSPALVGYPR